MKKILAFYSLCVFVFGWFIGAAVDRWDWSADLAWWAKLFRVLWGNG